MKFEIRIVRFQFLVGGGGSMIYFLMFPPSLKSVKNLLCILIQNFSRILEKLNKI